MRKVRLSESLGREDSVEERKWRSSMLRRYQLQSGYRIEDIATETGISVSLLYKIMNGSRPVKITQIRKILRAMSAPDMQPIINCMAGRYASLGSYRERMFDEVNTRIAERLLMHGTNRYSVQPDLAVPVMEYVAERLAEFNDRRAKLTGNRIDGNSSYGLKRHDDPSPRLTDDGRYCRYRVADRAVKHYHGDEHSYGVALEIYRRQTGTSVGQLGNAISKSKTQVYDILAGKCETSTGQIRAMLRCMGVPEIQPIIHVMMGQIDLIGTPLEALLERITLGLEDYLVGANIDLDRTDWRMSRAIVALATEAIESFNLARQAVVLGKRMTPSTVGYPASGQAYGPTGST